MNKPLNIWDPSGCDWLQENLCNKWPKQLETFIQDKWVHHEDWMMQCHPKITLLLLIRQYLLGNESNLDTHLRKLIPCLAIHGSSSLITSAMALLGLFTLENYGFGSDIDTLYLQIKNEPVNPGSLESLLSKFFFAQASVVKNQIANANTYYTELLNEKYIARETKAWILGRIYEKVALYVFRYKEHACKDLWEYETSEWCNRHPGSVLTIRLINLQKNAEKIKLILQSVDPIQPKNKWKSTTPLKLGHVRDLEVQILNCVLNEYQIFKPQIPEKLNFITQKYGDPFWIAQRDKLFEWQLSSRPHILQDVETAVYRFTFFETFQGYTKDDEVLFKKKYGRFKVKQLLALLLLQPNFRITKEALSYHLFEEDAELSGSNYLHVLLHRARDVLTKQSGISGEWIYIRDGIVNFNRARIIGIDVHEYTQVISEGDRLWYDQKREAIALYTKAINMFHPVISPEFEYEDWMSTFRTKIVNKQRHVLTRIWSYFRTTGEQEKGVHFGELLFTLDEWDLSVLHQLCSDWIVIGDSSKALHLCHQYAHALKKEGEEIPGWITEYIKTLKS